MKINKWFMLLGIAALMLCLMSAAGAETARVLTPGGKLNMRKSPDDKAKLVDTVPNRALVEVVEESGEWTKITYKKQTPGQTDSAHESGHFMQTRRRAPVLLICNRAAARPITPS